jgi:hypothetical protein
VVKSPHKIEAADRWDGLRTSPARRARRCVGMGPGKLEPSTDGSLVRCFTQLSQGLMGLALPRPTRAYARPPDERMGSGRAAPKVAMPHSSRPAPTRPRNRGNTKVLA